MLVGDLIISTRSQGPDPCQTITPGTPSSLVTAAGAAFGAGTWYLQSTALTPWGETTPSQEVSVILGAPGNIAGVVPFLPAAIAIRIYFANASGGEVQYQQFSTAGGPNPLPFTLTGAQTNATPPGTNRAYLPDTDGGFMGVYDMYRNLNETLKAAARVTNGIQDAVGIASVSGQRRYVATLNGQWLRLDQCFYDGWELDLGNKAETFRNRNLTANISISLMVDAQSDTTRVELYWTPSRTSGTSTTTGPITTVASLVPINPPSNWLLQDGYALLSDGTNNEIITYSAQSSSQLTGCIRGWSGTQPFAFAAGSTVQELNIELNGYRMPYVYSVGQSMVPLGVPPGWEPFLKDYLLGLFRSAEQEAQEAEGLMKKATTGLEQWVKSNKPVAGPRQCRMYGDYGVRGLVPGGLTGGIIIP